MLTGAQKVKKIQETISFYEKEANQLEKEGTMQERAKAEAYLEIIVDLKSIIEE